jgi:hypothetical protein
MTIGLPLAWIIVGAVMVVVLMMIAVQLIYRLGDFRTDIPRNSAPFGGRSRIWQVNVLRWSNYSPEGRSRLLALYTILALVSGALGAAILRMWSSE